MNGPRVWIINIIAPTQQRELDHKKEVAAAEAYKAKILREDASNQRCGLVAGMFATGLWSAGLELARQVSS